MAQLHRPPTASFNGTQPPLRHQEEPIASGEQIDASQVNSSGDRTDAMFRH